MISILTPVFNTDVKLLELCINSVKKQTFSEWELCLVNDCSTDPKTIEYLNRIQHPQIIVKHLDKNVGIGAATEEAFKMSSGEFIAFMDSDVVLETGWLSKLVEFLENNKDIGIVGGKLLFKGTNKINSAGGGINRLGIGFDIGRGEVSSKYDKQQNVMYACSAKGP